MEGDNSKKCTKACGGGGTRCEKADKNQHLWGRASEKNKKFFLCLSQGKKLRVGKERVANDSVVKEEGGTGS